MNILVLSWRDPKHPLAGGAEQVMHEHMKGWVRSGHNVTLFSSKMSGLEKKEKLDGVTIIRGGYQYWGVQFAAFFHYLKNRKSYDLIVDQFHGIPFFTPLYSRKPIVAVIQEPAGKVWLLNPLPRPLNWIIGIIGLLGEPFVFFLFYRATKFITGSKSAMISVSKLGIPIKNITVVPHGVLLKKLVTQPKKNSRPTIIYLGILSKDKGIEDALKCFAILRKKGKFNFWVVGREETRSYGERLNKMVKDLHLQKTIKFWGFVSQNKKFELLARASVLINPSIHEGWGLVNIEANSMSTPVVAYNSAGLIDSVKDGVSGIIVKRNTPEELARSILVLLNNPKELEKLQVGAKKWSNQFSWVKSRKLSLQVIKNLLTSN